VISEFEFQHCTMISEICRSRGETSEKAQVIDIGDMSEANMGSAAPLGENLIPLVNRLQDIFSQASYVLISD